MIRVADSTGADMLRTMNVTHCLLGLSDHLVFTDSLRDLTWNISSGYDVLSTAPYVFAVASETVADDPRRGFMAWRPLAVTVAHSLLAPKSL